MTVPSRIAGGHCPLSVPPSPARAGAPSPWAAALGGHGSPALAGAPRGSGHGDRDLASAWAAGAGGTPWLRAPLPTSHEVPCLPSPGGASPGRARWCRGSRAVPQFPPSQLRLCPLAPRCWLLAQRGTALPGGACCAGTAPRAARGARGAHPHPQRGLGAATVGKRRHEAAFDGGGRSCRSPPTQVGTPCPCGALGCWGVFGVLWGCERGTWGWTVRGTPPLGTGWPRMALWKLRVTDMGVSGFWGRQALVLAGGRPQVLGRMPRGDQAVPGGLSCVAGGTRTGRGTPGLRAPGTLFPPSPFCRGTGIRGTWDSHPQGSSGWASTLLWRSVTLGTALPPHRAAGTPLTPAATLGWASPPSPPIPHPRPCAPRAGVCPRAMAGWWRCGGRCPPRALAHGVSPQAVSHARAGVRVSGCPGVPRRGQEAAGGAAGGGGAFSVHPGSGGAAASGLQLEPGSAASSAGGDSGVPPAAGRAGLGAGMNLGIGVQHVPSCTLSPSPLPAGEVGTHPALLNTFGCCFVPSPCSPGPDTTMRGVARLVSVSPPRWHRGPLAGGGGGRGFPGRWRSSASAGTRREPGPLPPSASSTSKSCQIRVL